MNLPNFEITPDIENDAIAIVELLKELPAIDTDDTFLQLRKDNRLKSIQSSLAIEANSLSLRQVTDIIKSCIVHFAIEYIHPFEDGNGRMERLWQTVILHSWDKNFQWIPVETMVYQNHQGYYNALNLADKQNNITIFIQFMLDVLKFALDNIIVSRKKKTIYDLVNDPVNKKIIRCIKRNPRLNYEELAKNIGVSKATIKRRIQILKKSGLLVILGADKNGIWRVVE